MRVAASVLALAASACAERALPITVPDLAFAGPRYYSLDEATRACTRAAQCMIDDSAANCIADLTRLNPETRFRTRLGPHEVGCLAAAVDCASAIACFRDQTFTPQCAVASHCEGDALFTCSVLGAAGPQTWRFDCESIGAHCRSVCVIGGAFPCDESACIFSHPGCSAGAPFCLGSTVATCVSGVTDVTLDCGDFGAACVEEPGVGARCHGTGPYCDGAAPSMFLSSTNGCRDDRLVYCVEHQESTFDCASFGAHCVTDGNGTSSCR